MKKKNLIRYIQANDPFYAFANLSACSLEQLKAIQKEIRRKKSTKARRKTK